LAAPALLPIKLYHPATHGVESLGSARRVIVTAEILVLDDQECDLRERFLGLQESSVYGSVDRSPRTPEDKIGNASMMYGLFQVVDRALRHRDEFKQFLAHFDEQTKHWEVYGQPGEWLKVIIVPA
jgi:hypothetical protein